MSKELLETEAAIGDNYQRAWDGIVKPFFDLKTEELYGHFVNCPTTDERQLMLIKMQVNALNSLKDEFTSYINTGKLAKKQLEEE